MRTDTTETASENNLFQPQTILGRELWEICERIVVSGEPLRRWKEVTKCRNERL